MRYVLFFIITLFAVQSYAKYPVPCTAPTTIVDDFNAGKCPIGKIYEFDGEKVTQNRLWGFSIFYDEYFDHCIDNLFTYKTSCNLIVTQQIDPECAKEVNAPTEVGVPTYIFSVEPISPMIKAKFNNCEIFTYNDELSEETKLILSRLYSYNNLYQYSVLLSKSSEGVTLYLAVKRFRDESEIKTYDLGTYKYDGSVLHPAQNPAEDQK